MLLLLSAYLLRRFWLRLLLLLLALLLLLLHFFMVGLIPRHLLAEPFAFFAECILRRVGVRQLALQFLGLRGSIRRRQARLGRRAALNIVDGRLQRRHFGFKPGDFALLLAEFARELANLAVCVLELVLNAVTVEFHGRGGALSVERLPLRGGGSGVLACDFEFQRADLVGELVVAADDVETAICGILIVALNVIVNGAMIGCAGRPRIVPSGRTWPSSRRRRPAPSAVVVVGSTC